MSSSGSGHRHHRCKSQMGSRSLFDIDSTPFDLGDGGRRASRSGPSGRDGQRMGLGAAPMPHQRRGSMAVYMDGLEGMGLGTRGLRAGGARMGGGLGFGLAGGLSGIPEVGGLGLGMGAGLAGGVGGSLGVGGVGGLSDGMLGSRMPRELRSGLGADARGMRGFGMRGGLSSDLRATLGADFRGPGGGADPLASLGGAIRPDLPAGFGSSADPSMYQPPNQRQHLLRQQAAGLGTEGLDSGSRLQYARAELLNRNLRSALTSQHPGLGGQFGICGLQGIGRARGAYGTLYPLGGLNGAAGGIGGRPANYRSPYVEDYDGDADAELSVEELLAQAGYGQEFTDGYLYGHHDFGDWRGGFFL